MAPERLDDVGERLLKAGVAPRHVRRFVRELREHYDDLLRAELANGATLSAAECAALERLGTETELVQSMLDRPELRSTGARFPALVFGAGPALLWLGSVVVTLLILRVLARPTSPDPTPQSTWWFGAAHSLCLLYVRVLPIGLGAAALIGAARRRLRVHWAMFGATIVNSLGATIRVHHFAASQSGQGDQLGVSSALLPFLFPSSDVLGAKDAAALAQGLVRAAVMLALCLLAYLLWRARERSKLLRSA